MGLSIKWKCVAALLRPSDLVAALTFVVTFAAKPLYNMHYMFMHVLCLRCYTADIHTTTKDISHFCTSHCDGNPHLCVALP